MLDFAAWSQRVSAFLRQLTRLPGAIVIRDGIEPPADEPCDFERSPSEASTFPAEIERFLLTASRRCNFHYQWTPPSEQRGRLVQIYPDHVTLRGGGDLCEASKYENYANRDWFLGLNHDAASLAQIAGAMAEEQSQGRVPIMELEDKGVISLGLQAGDGTRTAVYVKRAGLRAHRILSPSFEQFLLDWETICYIYPTMNNLAPWLDPVTRQLRPDPAKSLALRRFLCGGQSSVPNNRHD